MSAPVVCNDSGKEKTAKTLTNLRGFLVRSRELESLALWLKEPTGQNTLILEVSSLRHFCAKHRDFPPGNFCTLCRILQVRVPHCIPWNRAKTVQKPCTYSGTNEKWWFLIHDLVAIWVTTKVNLIHGKKNAHSSEEFSGRGHSV